MMSSAFNEIFLFDSTRGAGFGSLGIWWVYFADVVGGPPDGADAHAGSFQFVK